MTRKSLENIALHYLERYSSSADRLRQVLMRRVERSVYRHGTDRATAEAWVAEVVAHLAGRGYLDDARYAEARILTLRRQGRSGRAIRAELLSRGVSSEDVARAVAATENTGEPGQDEMEAAFVLARRRKLGPYRPAEQRASWRMKDLAVLARAGFSIEIARHVIDAEV
ncbi:MAG: regulatory protein RecX [Alphaproteobacteria bacterium]